MDEARKRTLKEKWNDHWNNRKILPQQEQANLAGISFFWFFTVTLMISTLLFAIPHHYKHDESGEFWAKLFVYFIFIESVANWILCVLVKSSVHTSRSITQQGWSDCIVCQKPAPPRSHHCKICQTCVLKRDHHCFFTGVCVGFKNQRNFIVYTFYILVGSIYGIYLISHYVGQYYDVRSSEGWIFVPFVAFWKFVFGYLPLAHFVFLIQMYLCMIMSAVSGYFFLWQISVVLNGRTTYEVMKSIKKYQGRNIRDNLRNVFGPYWLIQFILPIPIALPGNGTDWNTDNCLKWQ